MTQVTICPYTPEWKKQFLQEKAQLDSALDGQHVELEHIGSTSVPGLASKDIIDILIQFETLPESEVLDQRLMPLGYRRKQVFSLEDYLYYVRGDRLKGFHVHITPVGHPCAQAHLGFRDILLNNDQVRDAYAALKQELSTRYVADRATYRSEKRAFIQKILEEHSNLDPAVIHLSQNSYVK